MILDITFRSFTLENAAEVIWRTCFHLFGRYSNSPGGSPVSLVFIRGMSFGKISNSDFTARRTYITQMV